MSAPNERKVLGPEELVLRENKVVNCLRIVLLVVLIVVGSSLSFSCYKLTSKAEERTYQNDFDVIALSFIQLFHRALTEVFWNAHTIGVAVSANSALVRTAPNITVPAFDKLPTGALETNNLNNVFWSPLISDETERKRWEAYAHNQLQSIADTPSDKCYVCGDGSLEPGLPEAPVVLPVGTFSCATLAWAGKSGVINQANCPAVTAYVQAKCQCSRPIAKGDATFETQKKNSSLLVSNQIYELSENGTRPVQGSGPYSPIWQVFPTGDRPIFAMYDLYSDPRSKEAIDAMVKTGKGVITKSFDKDSPNLWNSLWGFQADTWGNLLFSPVVADEGVNTKVIGSVVLDLDWAFISASTVPLGSKGIHIVLENSCGQLRTFQSNGIFVDYVGDGDLHDPNFSSMVYQSSYNDYRAIQSTAAPYVTGETSDLDCAYMISVYSSQEFRSSYVSKNPRLYALVIMTIFVFTSILFGAYDCYVSRRQRKVMNAALQRDEIVTSLFPTTIQERLFKPAPVNRTCSVMEYERLLRWFRRWLSLNRATGPIISPSRKPRTEVIADYFPLVTVIFADISGFTAWSSEREPSQVFELLETVYQTFDKIVSRLGVFKVETSGDCYVAAAGIPGYQPDHAVRAVKFAYECVLHMRELTQQLESSLGPSTLSLSIRVGVHSGPVIGGVLRGDKSRFQLFGDTMNTASRMQKTGEINTIQISSTTAHLLEEAGRSGWIQPRMEPVRLKGKGLVQTYWVDPLVSDEDTEMRKRDVTAGDESIPWGENRLSKLVTEKSSEADKTKRLVEWNTDLLLRLLIKVVASRSQRKRSLKKAEFGSISSNQNTPFGDVADILSVEEFHEKAAEEEIDTQSKDICENVREQLLSYITEIASLYRDNPFHNFEHASHVAMSAAKVVMRIVKTNVFRQELTCENKKDRVTLKRMIHDSTFGISSDLMLQFAAVFSAVIHDVDHTGVSNAQLVKEGEAVAVRYKNKCVAEQNSVDIAWNLLTKDEYKDFFQCICPNEFEKQRFRQLLVNAVIATDIADAELQQARKDRWDKACPSCISDKEACDVAYSKEDMDRKATIVFEYIIQASDVAHTMQHWKVYKQWNERLFEERYLAYLRGREEKDPSIGWFESEIWFFDHYIIPLAKKLETCGVFGVSSDEYLSHALENRHEWELKGHDIVREMVEKFSVLEEANGKCRDIIS